MSSSATIVNDREHAAGRHRGTQRQLHVNSSLPSADGDPVAAATTPIRQMTPSTPAVVPGSLEGNTRQRSQRGLPIAAVESGTGAENPRRASQRTRPPIAAVEPGTGPDNTRQRRATPTAAVQLGTRERNSTRGRPRSTPRTTDDNNNRRTKRRRPRVFERDLTPAERAIPDTGLLHGLGYHLSAYARAGRGPPTQNLNCRGAWRTAVGLYHKANNQYKELFIDAGFGDFLKIDPVDVPVAYNLALTERWFSETNTLHLPSCEIGPTPVDWTMVTGLNFGGRCIEVNSNFEIERALDLLGTPRAKKDGKIHLDGIKPSEEEVSGNPPTDDVKEKLFRRLFLYVVGSCFFNNNRSVISHHFVECLERINEVGSYDWGGITYATFLAGMRRKVTAEIGAFTAFWQFLPFWAFEYLDVNRPKHNEADVFPRARRWICPKGFSDNESPQFIGPQFIANRCQLNYVEESQVTWQPYLASAKYRSDAVESAVHLAKRRIPFQSIDTWEYYLGERCRQQLGFPCRVPNDPPQIMHGTEKLLPENVPAESLVKEGLDYASWFANNSIGRILDVTRFLGGPEIAGKVIDRWMANHLPDIILMEHSQFEKIKEDRNALEEECAKLREELSQARADESSHV